MGLKIYTFDFFLNLRLNFSQATHFSSTALRDEPSNNTSQVLTFANLKKDFYLEKLVHLR